jgi:hypothetical protein
MRRLLLIALLVPATIWLFAVAWVSCADDYRDALPLRTFDGAAKDPGRDLAAPFVDLTKPADLSTGDTAAPGDGMTDGGTDGMPG